MVCGDLAVDIEFDMRFSRANGTHIFTEETDAANDRVSTDALIGGLQAVGINDTLRVREQVQGQEVVKNLDRNVKFEAERDLKPEPESEVKPNFKEDFKPDFKPQCQPALKAEFQARGGVRLRQFATLLRMTTTNVLLRAKNT